MIDGTYNVEARTPLGTKTGNLVLATQGDACTADLTVAGKTKRLVGTVHDGRVSFEGQVHLPFPFGKLAFEFTGTVEHDHLNGACRTKKFSFDVFGTRTAG